MDDSKKEITEVGDIKLPDVRDQIKEEWELCDKPMRSKREAWRTYMKLLINQRKNPKKVGDTLMFSTHQTIMAALYRDRLDAEWMWREEEDVDRAEQINSLWEFDYEEMGKPAHDFGKYWDATFFGTAIEDWTHFDRKTLTPIPDLWDMMNACFDPKALSINGNRLSRGAMRFFGRQIQRTMQEMEDNGSFFNLAKLDADEKETAEHQKNLQAIAEARGLEFGQETLKHNKYYTLRQWFTFIKGKRYLVEAGNEGSTIVRLSPVKTDYWPLVDSHIYPDPHTFITPGVPDFTEDKQRARAVLQNNTLDAAKFDVLPMWLFDKKKIKNKHQLKDWRAGKMIEGEDINGNSVFPLTKPSIHQFTEGIMQALEMNAQKALATPEIQQGILFAQKRTATEIAEASANVDTRYNLTASLFGLAETNAAYMWLDQYKRNFKKGIDKKTIRVIGAFGPKPLPLTADTFRFKRDPDVKIESRYVSQAKKREQRNNLTVFGNVLLRTPGASIRTFAKKMGRAMFPKAEVESLLPPTIDEMRAEDENEKLNANKLGGVVIEPTDDHQVHMEIHGKAGDTHAKFAHIEAHKKAMLIQRNRPELFVNPLAGMTGGQPGAAPAAPSAPMPLEQTPPTDALKQEMMQ